MCLYPKLIRNPKYKTNKKNGGNIPTVTDNRTLLVPIGCGECIECCKQRRRNWQLRLTEDIKVNTNGKCVTLTFSNENYKKLAEEFPKLKGYILDNQIATRAVRLFLERWRKKYKKSVRHFLVTELGKHNTEHIHLHGIIWADDIFEIERIWQYGYVYKGKLINGKLKNWVNGRTVNYITKYITKKDEKHKKYKQIVLCSKGIGANYLKTYNSTLNKFTDKNTNETYRTESGHKIALPIYWRNKIYTEEEREKLWIAKMDLNVRYVCGEKVVVNNTNDDYWKLVKYYRELNTELGYGGSENWKDKERAEYEHQLRIIKQQERIKRGLRPGP